MTTACSRALPRLLGAFLVPAAAAQDDGEFSARGAGVVRVESEVKLGVPRELTEDVWRWLRARYAAPGFLDRDGHAFSSAFGDERFVDRYFDTPELQLLGRQSGIRHRSRFVREGAAMRKDGRQLVQLKLNREDQSGLERSEIKFDVSPPRGVDPATAPSVFALVDRDDCQPLGERIVAAGVDPYRLQPVLTIEQDRRRVYLTDQHGAFATLTLDTVSCDGWWQELAFTEIELELNEIRYTEADGKTRAWMNEVTTAIQADLQAAFPGVVQDQTPKYNKAFAMLEAGMPLSLPLRRMVGWRLTPGDVVALALVVLGGAGALVAWAVLHRRRRARAAA